MSVSRRVAYTILANPFLHDRNNPMEPLMNGPVASVDTLHLHLSQIAALETQRLAAILLLMPHDTSRSEVPGYRNITTQPHSLGLPCPLEVIAVHNNTLGSYGMYLRAFASTRGRFGYYIFCEDDYVPALDHFDAALVLMHDATFGSGRQQRNGVLAGVLQGRPAEPDSKHALHLETSHIMSARSLGHLFDHTYSVIGWRGSMAERMMLLVRVGRRGVDNPYYGGGIQEGFGLLCSDAGIEMRDWSLAYRSPYWNHRWIVDWTGMVHNFSLPMARALFVPVQLRYGHQRRVKSCCEPTEAACKGTQRTCFLNAPASGKQRLDAVLDCCQPPPLGTALWRRARLSLSVPADAANVEDAFWRRRGA